MAPYGFEGGVSTRLNLRRHNGGYIASITSPDGRITYWSTSDPMPRDVLIEELFKLDRHTTDIGDALAEADWYFQRRGKKTDSSNHS